MRNRFNTFLQSINRRSEKIAIIVVAISVLWIFLGPILLTKFSIVEIEGGNNIGDAIGGITAPVIGLVSIVLLYMALLKQIESNNNFVHEANFRILNNEIEQIRIYAENFTFNSKYDKFGFNEFLLSIAVKLRQYETTDDQFLNLYNTLFKYEIILIKFQKANYLLENLKTSLEYETFIKKEIYVVYYTYFNEQFNNVLKSWPAIDSIHTSEISVNLVNKMQDVKGRIKKN